MRYLSIILVLVSSLFFSCTPYNSDQANKKMLQGEWLLVDSTIVDSVMLIFDADVCREYIPSKDYEATYKLSIRNYWLTLHESDSSRLRFDIVALSNDSLVLDNGNRIGIYKKIAR